MTDTRRQDFLIEAARYKGTTEAPRNSNRGIRIDYWTTECEGELGGAWCAFFVHGAGVQAVGRKNWPFKRSGRVQDVVDDARKRGLFTKDVSLVTPGDLLVLWYPTLDPPRYGHIAVLTGLPIVASHVQVESIDGNSNADGSREGYEVAEKKGALARPLTDRFGFIRWPDPL